MATPQPDPIMKALPSNIVGYVIAALLALGVVLHAVFPRYDWRLVGDNGTVIVVHDRWSNRFQRAVYDDQGNVTAMKVYIPF